MISIGKKSLTKTSLMLILFLIFSILPYIAKSDVSGPQLRVENSMIEGNLWSKKVVVYNNENKHYYNVSVSTDIPENLIDVELYRYITSNLKMKVTSNPVYSFQIIDSDGNGLTDTIKWIVPELSEVSFSVEGELNSNIPSVQYYGIQTTIQTTSPQFFDQPKILDDSKTSKYRTANSETICNGNSCAVTYYPVRKLYYKNASKSQLNLDAKKAENWEMIDTNFEVGNKTYDWIAEKNIFKMYVKDNMIKLVGEENSKVTFWLPVVSKPDAKQNVLSYDFSYYKEKDDYRNAIIDIKNYPEMVEKLITIYNMSLPANVKEYVYTEDIDLNSINGKFIIGSAKVWDSTITSVCEENDAGLKECYKQVKSNYYPVDWVYNGHQISLTIDRSWLDKATYPIYIDPTAYYNFSVVNGNRAYGQSANATTISGAATGDTADPPTFAQTFTTNSLNFTQGGYVSLSAIDTVRANITSDGNNEEPLAYFNFTVVAEAAINWVNVTMVQRENIPQPDTDCNYYIANWTTGSFFSFGAVVSTTTDTTRSRNITSSTDINNIVDSRNVVTLLTGGTQSDAREGCAINYVEVKVGYTDNPPLWSDNSTKYSSPIVYRPSVGYGFEVTWIDVLTSPSVVFLEWNGSVNYTMSNTDSVYYYNITDLAVGNYTWKSYANDTSNNWNITNTWGYNVTINSSANVDLYLNDSQANFNMGVSQALNTTVILNNIAANNIEIWTNYSDGTWKKWANCTGCSSLSNVTVINTAGLFNFTANFTNNVNYTSSYENWYVDAVNIVEITLSQALSKGILFDTVIPNTKGNPARNNTSGPSSGTEYNVTVGSSSTNNIDFYVKLNDTFEAGIYANETSSTTSASSNFSTNTTIDASWSIQGNTTSNCTNTAVGGNCWMRLYFSVGNVPTGYKERNYIICGVVTGSNPSICG